MLLFGGRIGVEKIPPAPRRTNLHSTEIFYGIPQILECFVVSGDGSPPLPRPPIHGMACKSHVPGQKDAGDQHWWVVVGVGGRVMANAAPLGNTQINTGRDLEFFGGVTTKFGGGGVTPKFVWRMEENVNGERLMR